MINRGSDSPSHHHTTPHHPLQSRVDLVHKLSEPSLSQAQIRLSAAAMAARRLLLLLAVVAASLLAADARPCHTFLVAFPADPNPNPNPSRGDGAVHHHLGIPHVATVITVFRVRRLGPQVPHGHRNHHLHSIPANVQIHRPDLPHPAAGSNRTSRTRTLPRTSSFTSS